MQAIRNWVICETKIFTKVLQYTRSDLPLRRVATSFATSCRLGCTDSLTHRSCILEKVGKTHSNTPRNIQFAAQFRRKTRSITSFYKITKTRVHLTLHVPPHETTCPASHHLQKPVCGSLSNHPTGRSPFSLVLLLAFMGCHHFEWFCSSILEILLSSIHQTALPKNAAFEF